MNRGIQGQYCIEVYGDVWVHGFIHGCMINIEVYGDEKRYMEMYRGAWYYTWMYGDVQGCMVMYRGTW